MTETTERPLVTFAVIAYNQERFIREAIEGAFAQTYEPLEIILSDDCSPDRTFEIMQEMAAAYDGPHKVVLNRNEPNLGLVPHIDRVMELVSGEFIVVNAGDDVSVPERTRILTDIWRNAGGEITLVHSPAMSIDENGRVVGERHSNRALIDDPTPHTIAAGCLYVLGATASWDRAVFDVFGPISPGVSTEDIVIPFRAAILGRIAYVSQKLVKHRTGGVSGVRSGGGAAHDYLYGLSHKARKWQSEVDFYVLKRFRDVTYSRKAEVEAICRNRGPVLRFAVDLAETEGPKRWLMAPTAVRLALRHRTSTPLKDWARYTFERLYVGYANWRITRRKTDEQGVPKAELSENK